MTSSKDTGFFRSFKTALCPNSDYISLEVGYYGNELSISRLLTYFGKMGLVHKKSLQNTLTKNTYLQNRIESLFENAFMGGYFVVINLYIWHHKSQQTLYDYIDILHEREKPIAVLLNSL